MLDMNVTQEGDTEVTTLDVRENPVQGEQYTQVAIDAADFLNRFRQFEEHAIEVGAPHGLGLFSLLEVMERALPKRLGEEIVSGGAGLAAWAQNILDDERDQASA